MKKLISVILAAVMLTTILPVFAEQSETYSQEMILMKNLGIVQGYEDGTLRPESNITRMEFVTMALRLMGYRNVGTSYASKDNFADVTAGLWGASNINFAYELGIVDGHSKGVFDPEGNVTVNQAVKILLCILDYKEQAEESGGYPTGYLTYAARLGITVGITTGENAATREEVATLFANALEAEVIEKIYHADGTAQWRKSGKTLLDIMGLKKVTGMVNAVPGISIANDANLEDNQILVENTVYEVTYGDVTEYIGSEVMIYIDDRDQYKHPHIVHMEELDTNKTVKVYARDIDDSTTLSTFVYDTEDSTRQIDFGEEPLIIYNGTMLSTSKITNDVLKPETGYITIKTVSGKTNAIVFVWEFENYVIQSVKDKKLYDLFGNSLDLKSNRFTVRAEFNESVVDIDAIQPGDIVSVAESEDKNFYKLLISRDSLEGSIQAVYSNNNSVVYKISGDETYTLAQAENYAAILQKGTTKLTELYAGDAGIFYLDAFGDIAYSRATDSTKNELQYGYIVKAATDSTLSGATMTLKVMTTNNQFVDYEFSSRRSTKYGFEENGTYTTTKNLAEFIKAVLPGGEPKTPIFKYKTNDEGEINELYMLDTTGTTDVWGTSMNASKTYGYYNGVINGNYIIDANTMGFYIPNSGGQSSLFKSGRAITMMSSSSYLMQLYDIVDNSAGLVIIKTKLKENEGGYDYIIDMVNSPVMLVEEVGSSLGADGEVYDTISGYQDGEWVSVMRAKQLEPNSESAADLKPGMLIQYLMNTEQRSYADTSDEAEVMIMYRSIENLNYGLMPHEKWNYTDVEVSNAKIHIICGVVGYYDGNNLIVNCGNQDAAAIVDDNVNVIRWNRIEKKAEPASLQDIMEQQEILIRTRYNKIRDVYIFE